MSKPTATAGWNVKRCASKKRTESINFNFITATSYGHRGYVSFPFFNRRVKKKYYPRARNVYRMFYKQRRSFNADYYLRGKFFREL